MAANPFAVGWGRNVDGRSLEVAGNERLKPGCRTSAPNSRQLVSSSGRPRSTRLLADSFGFILQIHRPICSCRCWFPIGHSETGKRLFQLIKDAGLNM